jgi:Zn finger protein HypA/HybF involved in hydrogenase expression
LTFTIGGYGFTGVAIALLLFALFRIFSRNTAARRNELNAWNVFRQKLKYRAAAKQSEYRQRSEYKYFRCPNCKQKLRVPRGKGKLQVTCSRCQTKFIKKS